jgi:hypothetical protein
MQIKGSWMWSTCCRACGALIKSGIFFSHSFFFYLALLRAWGNERWSLVDFETLLKSTFYSTHCCVIASTEILLQWRVTFNLLRRIPKKTVSAWKEFLARLELSAFWGGETKIPRKLCLPRRSLWRVMYLMRWRRRRRKLSAFFYNKNAVFQRREVFHAKVLMI